ncbi:MAG: TSUP family transporter [Gemmatimonadaceae bacterium]
MTWFLAAVFLVAVLAGGTAAIAGFGIGSLLTPLLASRLGMTLAIAAVAIPHALATALRCWRLRGSIDWALMRGFGLLSAAGGLAGALLYTRFSNDTLTVVLGVLLIATSIAGLTNWSRRIHLNSRFAPHALGFASGVFGGVAGNQGGLRAAALLTFSLMPLTFVATSTATGLLVDAVRLPVYLWRSSAALVELGYPIVIASVGVVMGTLAGERMLVGLSADRFRTVVSVLIGLLGLWLLLQHMS